MKNNLYLQRNSEYIYQNIVEQLNYAANQLIKLGWVDKTKPRDGQLQATVNCSEKLEKIWDEYFEQHLSFVRKAGYQCEMTRQSLEYFQIYRKQGILSVLKKYSPQVGKERPKSNGFSFKYSMPSDMIFGEEGIQPVEAKRYTRKTPATNIPPINRESISRNDGDGFGDYGTDWIWAKRNGFIGKISMIDVAKSFAGIIYYSDRDTQRVGHAAYISASSQENFNRELIKLKEDRMAELTGRLPK